MAGEKYIVATSDNPTQINIRNILNPGGYNFITNCVDAVSLMRLIRSYHPDFVVVDMNFQYRELKNVFETMSDELLCACVLIANHKDSEVVNLLECSSVLMFSPKPLSKELFLHTVDMANINYKRIAEIGKKLKEVTESFETRKVVERAKWIIMEREKISENEAYERIRRKSMDTRMTMKQIADAVIFTHELGNK